MDGVLEINRFEDLLGHQLAWDALWPDTPCATFFHSFDWFAAYWRSYGATQRMRALIVQADGRSRGILPLVVRTEPTRVGRVRVLTYPLHDWATFYGPIGPDTAVTLRAGLKHVRATPRDWDLLDLRWIDDEGADRGLTPQAMIQAGFQAEREVWARTSLIEMRDSWDAYWKSRTKKWRHNVSRCQRRLSECGQLTYVRYRPRGEAHGDADPRWDLYEACVRLAQCSWQGSSTTGTTLSHAEVTEYLRQTHEVAVRRGCLDLNLLLVDDRPAAFAYNYCYQGRVFGLRMGYDPELASVGPGTVLQRLVLEDSFRRGDVVYDMGAGYAECKRHWRTSLAASCRYTHFPWSVPRAQLLRLRRWIRNRWHPDHVAYADSA
jgi:CelD/BcsL family acetyltransferase involved in cellulose biosynthesis